MTSKRFSLNTVLLTALVGIIVLLCSSGIANAQPVASTDPGKLDSSGGGMALILLAAFFVYFMQTGFAMVEMGLTRAKNAINIAMKCFMSFCVVTLVYWMIGFGLMYGTSYNHFIGTDGFALAGLMVKPDGSLNHWPFAFLFLQIAMAAIAASIVSGALAERNRFIAYLLFTVILTAVIYPIFGHWAWAGLLGRGQGWLEKLGFIDCAGSTVIHSLGGWAALAGAICLGPRLGKYTRNGLPQAIPGHNLPLAVLGVLILWLGWFGLNMGNTVIVANKSLPVVVITTALAGAAGAITAMIISWIKFNYPDAGMSLNGALAGLVAISAGCACVSPFSAILIGSIAGVLVVLSVMMLESKGIDDPVGVVSVHGTCGVWGTLSVGLFAQTAFGAPGNGLFFGGSIHQTGIQALGVTVCFLWSFFMSTFVFLLIKYSAGLRVSELDEMEGLDYSEHGGSAYPDFTIVMSR